MLIGFVFQYDDPNIPVIPIESPEKKPEESKDIGKLLFVIVGILVLVILYIVFFSSGGKKVESISGNGICEIGENCFDNPDDCPCREGQVCIKERKRCVSETENLPSLEDVSLAERNVSKKSFYGNGVCDPGENCFDHPNDCKCKSGDYCSNKKTCVTPVCGNKVCEIEVENPSNCCFDCRCNQIGYFCNYKTKVCELMSMNLTEERALILARRYFEDRGFQVESIESLGIYGDYEKLVWRVKVQISGEPFSRQVGVTDEEEIISYELM